MKKITAPLHAPVGESQDRTTGRPKSRGVRCIHCGADPNAQVGVCALGKTHRFELVPVEAKRY